MSQNGPRIDLRVRRTRKLLRDALVNLIEEEGFDNIKIAQIADRAMINRVTFYRYYRDKYDFLTHCMDDVFEELEAQARPTHNDTGEIDHRAPGVNIEAMFGHIGENANFYRVMLGKNGSGAFISRLRDFLWQVSAKRWHQITPDTSGLTIPPDMTLHFTTSAYVGVVIWWVENNCPYSPSDMAVHLLNLTLQGPYRALGLQPPA